MQWINEWCCTFILRSHEELAIGGKDAGDDVGCNGDGQALQSVARLSCEQILLSNVFCGSHQRTVDVIIVGASMDGVREQAHQQHSQAGKSPEPEGKAQADR